MDRTRATTLAAGLGAMAVGLIMAGPAFGLVLFPDDESPPAVRPSDDVLGLWLDASQALRASCVAVGPSYVVTTRHQGGGVGSFVTIAGHSYPVLEVFEHATADIRVVRIVANLSYFVGPYDDSASESSQPVVLGGYGKSRDGELTSGGQTYGYSWTAASDKVLRWGANTVYGWGTAVGQSMTTDVLTAYFDAAGATWHVASEAAPAEFDSGGGWFFNAGTPASPSWRLMALSRGVEHYGETWFLHPGVNTLGDIFDGVKVKSYAGWMKGVTNPSTWTGGSSTWSTASHWLPSGVPNALDAWAVFGTSGASPLTITLDSNALVGTLRFDGTTDYTISTATGRRLTFGVSSGSAGIEVNRMLDPLATVAPTIAVPIWTNFPLVLNQNSGGLLTLSGIVSGTGSLTKAGYGTAVLTNTNAFTGGVTVKAGTLRVTSSGGLGSGPIVLSGGALEFRQDASATLNNSVTDKGNATIYVDRNVSGSGQTITVGSLTFSGDWQLTCSSTSGYGLAFSGTTSFQGSVGSTLMAAGADVTLSGGVSLPAGSLTKTGSGALTVAGPQSWGAGTALNVGGGTVRLNTDTGTSDIYNLTLNVSGAGSRAELKTTEHLAAMNLSGAGAASLASGGGNVLVAKSLTLDPATSQLDLTYNSLILKYSGASPLDLVAGWLRTGYNQNKWNGNGIVSSAAANSATYAVGYAENDLLPVRFTQFAGEPVDGNTVLARYTYLGDLNLDGKVDDNDVTILALNYDHGAATNHYWFQGDIWGYDGRVDDNDVTVLVLNYRRGVTQPLGSGTIESDAGGPSPWPAMSADAPQTGVLLPEPATLALLALGGLALIRRRPS